MHAKKGGERRRDNQFKLRCMKEDSVYLQQLNQVKAGAHRKRRRVRKKKLKINMRLKACTMHMEKKMALKGFF